MISLKKASARIGAIDVIQDIDLDAKPGELLAVIGANGAGKTSLLRAVSGLLPLSNLSLAPTPVRVRALRTPLRTTMWSMLSSKR